MLRVLQFKMYEVMNEELVMINIKHLCTVSTVQATTGLSPDLRAF